MLVAITEKAAKAAGAAPNGAGCTVPEMGPYQNLNDEPRAYSGALVCVSKSDFTHEQVLTARVANGAPKEVCLYVTR